LHGSFFILVEVLPILETSTSSIVERSIFLSDLDHAQVEHRPRLLSDNGSCYVSGELRSFLERRQIEHTRSAPYHSMTQGKIECYHCSMKNIVNLQNYFLPTELEIEIANFVNYYNHQRYHETLNNLTPADVYFGQTKEVLTRRDHIKRQTL
jgi:transposase InsO family protein